MFKLAWTAPILISNNLMYFPSISFTVSLNRLLHIYFPNSYCLFHFFTSNILFSSSLSHTNWQTHNHIHTTALPNPHPHTHTPTHTHTHTQTHNISFSFFFSLKTHTFYLEFFCLRTCTSNQIKLFFLALYKFWHQKVFSDLAWM